MIKLVVGNLTPLFTSTVSDPFLDHTVAFALQNQSANLFFSGPVNGSASAPTFRAIDIADIPVNITAASKIFNYLNIF